jgi:hypothetical protein
MQAERGSQEAGFVRYHPKYITVRGARWGFEYSRVGVGETPYLDRWIIYAFGGTLRLHKFWRGDDDRAPHDHPWNFWTFPLATYIETVEEPPVLDVAGNYWFGTRYENRVPRFRWSRRPATYRHIVRGRADGSGKPFFTIVVTGPVTNGWGFWPLHDKFIPYRQWMDYVRKHFTRTGR